MTRCACDDWRKAKRSVTKSKTRWRWKIKEIFLQGRYINLYCRYTSITQIINNFKAWAEKVEDNLVPVCAFQYNMSSYIYLGSSLYVTFFITIPSIQCWKPLMYDIFGKTKVPRYLCRYFLNINYKYLDKYLSRFC